MFKLTGALMIVAASAGCGFIRADRLKKRCCTLEGVFSALRLLENEIVYGKRDIKSVLRVVGEIQNTKIFRVCSEYVDSLGVRNAFVRAVEEEVTLLGTDKSTLYVLAENLGMTDTETQVKNIRHAAGLLENALADASENYEKSAKLYRSGGVLAGVAAVILLM